jgi:signal transduction histidine kinase
MKVTTKLITVLAAPVVVLIVIAAVGVTQRLSDADDAQRVEQVTEFIQVNSNLINELQEESIWSAAYMGTYDESLDDEAAKQRAAQAGYTEALAQQRLQTDEALVAFEAAVASVDPASESEAVADALKNSQDRLAKLQTTRNSVDLYQTTAADAIDQFYQLTLNLIDIDSSLVQTASDPDLLIGLTTVANYERFKNEKARLGSFAVAVSSRGAFISRGGTVCESPVTLEDCTSFASVQQASTASAGAATAFERFATAADKSGARNVINSLALDDFVQEIIESETATVEVAPAEVVAASLEALNTLNELGNRFIAQVNATAGDLAADAQSAVRLYLLLTGAAIILALGIAFLVARATTVPLRKLTNAAYSLSTDKLPGLVERLRNPDEREEPLSATLTPIDIDSKDEVGQLADAFNSIQQVTVEVAEEQAQLLRKGIGDIFINLARRNQTLLDRQIEFIDQLEANEEDPDQLDNLFKLDHLATRMRRNAESLLVLAGAEPPRRRGRPVALADVVRVAIGEVEDFARIQLLALDEATVGGNVAVDLAHLLSELMENATHFSPPDTTVEIVGHRSEDGTYVLSVSDQGIGMSADQLGEANVQLSRPPLVGLAMSRSLGFIVIGRLSSRFDISVKLTASPSGGVTALVTLPTDLVTYPGEEAPPQVEDDSAVAAIEEAPAGTDTMVEDELVIEDEVVVEEPALDDVEPVVAEEEPEVEQEVVEEEVVEEPAPFEPVVATSDDLLDELVEEVVPEGDDFERGLQSLVDDELAPGPIEPPAPVGTTGLADSDSVPGAFGSTATIDEAPVEAPEAETVEAPAPAPAASVEAEPAEAKLEPGGAPLTASGLVRRTPKNRSSNAVGGGMPTVAAARATGQSQRSPEEVRKMLSRYRSGLNKGRGSADSDEKS